MGSFLTPTMTLADIYHYPTQHFDFHRRPRLAKFKHRTTEEAVIGAVIGPVTRPESIVAGRYTVSPTSLGTTSGLRCARCRTTSFAE